MLWIITKSLITPPPFTWNPLPSLSAHRWGGEKLLFRRTKYSAWSQECKQQGTTNPSCLKQLLTADSNRTQSPDFLFFDQFFCSALHCLQIYSYACSEQQDSLGWSQRLNLYWCPSTHPLALGVTLLRIIGNFLASDRAIDRQGFGVLSSSQILSLRNPKSTDRNKSPLNISSGRRVAIK